MSSTHTLQAWSSTVRLVVDDEAALAPAVADLTALLERVDLLASRFRPDSAVSVANALAGRPVPIPRMLVDLVGAALDAAADTDGAVDPTLGLAMQRLGYDREIAELRELSVCHPDTSERHADKSAGAAAGVQRWKAVRLHREAGILRVPVGCALDLGATAKAWTADHAAHTLAARYGTPVLVELGGDVAVAGERPGGWTIRVAERAGDAGQLVRIRRGGLTSSTTTVRTWRRGDGTAHHIVDPRTGEPTDGPWRTVSVAAGSALAANTASTAAIVLGGAALDWLAGRGTAARLVDQLGDVVTTGAWPTEVRTLPLRRPLHRDVARAAPSGAVA
jgi:FAD:protein FMN transferase